MNNYEYIIATLPVLDRETGNVDADALTESVLNLCEGRDRELVGLLLDGFDRDKLGVDYYRRVQDSRNAFLRDYMSFDLLVRNTKVEYLNKALGRPEGTDIVLSEPEFDEKPKVLAILAQDDILSRERDLDTLMWDKAEELTLLHIFDMDVILAFLAKLKIADRWNKLDPETGRQLFRRLVEEIRKTR